jgi:hypothetical protein
LLVAFGLALVACSKENNVDQSRTVFGVGQKCGGAVEAACGDSTVCVLGYCRTPCAHDGECDADAACIGDAEFGCSLAFELGCSSSQPCDEPLGCDPNGSVGVCRNVCESDDECALPNYACVDDVCVPKP